MLTHTQFLDHFLNFIRLVGNEFGRNPSFTVAVTGVPILECVIQKLAVLCLVIEGHGFAAAVVAACFVTVDEIIFLNRYIFTGKAKAVTKVNLRNGNKCFTLRPSGDGISASSFGTLIGVGVEAASSAFVILQTIGFTVISVLRRLFCVAIGETYPRGKTRCGVLRPCIAVTVLSHSVEVVMEGAFLAVKVEGGTFALRITLTVGLAS